MSFGDGLFMLGHDISAKQVEDAAADLKDYVIPFPCQVEDFGVYITENFVAQATDPIVALQTKTSIGGSATTKVTLTLGGSNTVLKKGDAVKVMQTAITADTDLDNGHVVLGKRTALPFKLNPGDVLTIRHDGAATGAGGAYIPIVLLRIEGVNMKPAVVWAEDA